MYKSFTRPAKTSGVTRYTGVTQQHDKARIYKKKYMRKGKKRAWKKFVKKVQAVNLKDRGLVTALYNNLFSPVAESAGAQLIFEMHLYGFKSAAASSAAGCNDIATLISSDFQTRQGVQKNFSTNALETTFGKDGAADKIMFESAILDATISNNNSTTVEIDVYAIRYNKFTKGNFSTLRQAFQIAENDLTSSVQGNVGPGQPLLTLDSRGCTPFEIGKGISASGIQILGKEKYLISAGQAITVQLRDPKNRYFNASDFIESSTSYKYSNWTQTYLIIGKKVVEDETPMTLRIGCTRSYKYTYEGLKDNKAYKLTL